MSQSLESPHRCAAPPSALGDFTADRRVLLLLLMASAVGSAGAFSAWLLLKLIALVTNLVWFGQVSTVLGSLAGLHPGWRMIVIPAVGGLIVGLMARYGSDKIRGHGIPEAIEAILIGGSRLSPKVAVLKPLSSAIAIGTGGPFGAEGPIIMTGGAFGSLFAQFFHLSAMERKTLLVAGAAAGMTGIFGTPVAAVLLSVELLLFEWKPRSLLPVIVAVLAAASWRPFLLGAGPLFPFAHDPMLPWWALFLFLGAGVAAGLQSSLLTTMLYKTEDLFERLPVHWMWWPAIGGIIVGLGGLIEPGAMGVGYDMIAALLSGHMPATEVERLLLVKAVIWIVALASGTSGGVLAPLFILGGALGALEGLFLPGGAGFWALLGMSATMGGAMRAPLTGALFAVELTGDLHALPALLAANGAAYAVTVLILKRSILTEKIARRGVHIACEYGTDPFERMRVSEIMVGAVDTLPASMPIDEAIAFFTTSAARHKTYPMIDAEGRLIGTLHRAAILRLKDAGSEKAAQLRDLLSDHSPTMGRPEELVGSLADRMAMNDVGCAPIVDATGRLVGIVSRKDILRVRVEARALEQERSVFLGRRRVNAA
ncbi:chloride channel protein [Methylovirgula sp. HY1]|uniref:chloride channel protein n=1 Tax=Methylovirgula sp. HY1 TaxID=2822761 RepID=UPI001C5A6102|nr:chloride channel protein [Methylovirgula sp. HY1]QXX74150.1 H(+)/Cl(-) exchange transporter ClcA [Methylovirgula sp. HY1]